MSTLKNRRPLLSTIGCVLLLIGVAWCFAFGRAVVHADSMPGGNVADPVVRAVDIAKPAVVRIITTVPGQLTVHFSATTDVTFPQTNPNHYPLQLSGTGTFITSHGDILTADHVVSPPKGSDLDQGLYRLAAQDVADYMNKNVQAGSTSETKDDVLQKLSGGQLSTTTSYGTPSSTAFLSTDYTGPLTAPDFNSLPNGVALQVDKIEKESAPNQQDTAVIHVPMTDSPSVQLGDSSNVHQLDTLTIIGFPGAADVTQTPDGILTSSVNTISVSSIKTGPSGDPLIQVGGNVEHGDSGGPALDNQGNVVGIVSFGLQTANGTGGTSFLQASKSANAMVTSLNLDTKPGPFQQLWNQAFQDYASTTSGHWQKAQQGFSQLASTYPLFQAVQPYLNYTQTQTGNSQGVTPTAQTSTPTAQATATATALPSPTASATKSPAKGSVTIGASPMVATALTIGAILLLLLILLAFFSVTLRSRKKKSSTAAAANSIPAAVKPVPETTVEEKKASPTPNLSTPTVQPAKPVTPLPPTIPAPNSTQSTLQLKVWPCGHMNRPNARFCSICGEPAP